MVSKAHQALFDDTMRFLFEEWKREKRDNPAKTPGWRVWLHKAGIQTADDIDDIKHYEVPWPEPREDNE